MSTYTEYVGQRLTRIPARPGLYAWYYRPKSVDREAILRTLGRFFSSESQVNTTVTHRYGVKLIGSAQGEIVFGSEEESVPNAMKEAFDRAEPFLEWFFQSQEFVHFCRPIYIGIAKNLNDRVYKQHYVSLTEFWEDNSSVTRYMSVHPDASVQKVMDALELPHSFALEARVRGIPPMDLVVSILETDQMPESIGPDNIATNESKTRRALERLLQLLADPICGRR
ncbi:hypothetical protein [Azospirillum tabaci]|uniref:hypothetical protein n=1 Tax=Azospirillum tabaci TaxID=2752310 RepID=UPI001B3BAF63|nr:hypothetical protein [Azospirillum tabaci]